MPRSYAHLQRLFVGPDLSAGIALTLNKEQSLYLAAVLRKSIGDEVILFNGRDGAWLCRLTSDSKKSVALDVVERIAPQPPPSDLWYGFAPLKNERLDYVIQKAVEMGAGTIQPVQTQYTQVHRLKHERLAANAIEAAEQCEVLNVPIIAPETGLDQMLDGWRENHGDRKLIFADEGEAPSSPLSSLLPLAGQRIGLIVGPEGGFSETERTKLRSLPFVVPVSLGPRILRADTAAVAAMAIIQATIGDWR
ncbi:16S rRNA (uracil(1498)-N(3))-methyltransferase [Devosia faecipullorum]|uniref:16S rRNA (uracil(1498)-N(3))-methyltransferase n=1 Tax=Devosia faecipullorum TaxID=2755039 RepID=UPI00187B86A2|nr:16S rRNA (uracil(1498)-N(3))-methyltransferase [Devosia faecipullorum]MBE7733864.1 16S rRNA (uracil(1498)-N(3))-methyltransferase [Devosia faecipullorum]